MNKACSEYQKVVVNRKRIMNGDRGGDSHEIAKQGVCVEGQEQSMLSFAPSKHEKHRFELYAMSQL